jgi:hypothetical protein
MALVNELTMMRIVAVAVARRTDVARGAQPLPYGPVLPVAALSVLAVIILVAGALGVALLPWNTARVLAAVVTVYLVIWLLALGLAPRAVPHEVNGRRLRLRYATWFRVDIPVALIKNIRVEHRNGYRKPTAVEGGELVIAAAGRTSVVAELRDELRPETLEASGPVRRVRFHAERPEDAVREIGRLAAH